VGGDVIDEAEGARGFGHRLLLLVLLTCAFSAFYVILATAAHAEPAYGTQDGGVDRPRSAFDSAQVLTVPLRLDDLPTGDETPIDDQDRSDEAREGATAPESIEATEDDLSASATPQGAESNDQRDGALVREDDPSRGRSGDTPPPSLRSEPVLEAARAATIVLDSVDELVSASRGATVDDEVREAIPALDATTTGLGLDTVENHSRATLSRLDPSETIRTPARVLDPVGELATGPTSEIVDVVRATTTPALDTLSEVAGGQGVAPAALPQDVPPVLAPPQTAFVPQEYTGGGPVVSAAPRTERGDRVELGQIREPVTRDAPEPRAVSVDVPGAGLPDLPPPGTDAQFVVASPTPSSGTVARAGAPPQRQSSVPVEGTPSPGPGSSTCAPAGPSSSSTVFALLPTQLALSGPELLGPFGPRQAASAAWAFLSLAERPG
jgi:hypothetical protein